MPIRCCNPCPCMPLKLAVILVAIVDAGLKLIASIVVRSSLIDLDEKLKYVDLSSSWSYNRRKVGAHTKPTRCFPRRLRLSSLLCDGIVGWSSADTNQVVLRMGVGSILTLILYLSLFGIEYKEKTKEQYFFTEDTVYMLIWKLGVETLPFLYYTFVVLAFINQVGEEMREPPQLGEETVQSGSPAQDQPGDQPINVETKIVNP